jgi:uncharacterized heparinase superfamily protein
VGPDYLPGHAHADTLSFELSLFGQRVLVNSGTSQYGVGPERSRQRGTAAHNTVIVDGRDSSEVWAGFRVARRARPVGLEIIPDGRISVRCAHDGYQSLPSTPAHSRHWQFDEQRLVVEDRISGDFGCAEARFHVHPSVRAEPDGSAALLQLPLGQILRITADGGLLRIEASSWHREFGVSQPSLCVVVAFAGPSIRTTLDWEHQE